MANLLVRGGTLLHLDPPQITRADVRIEEGLIAEVGALTPAPDEPVLDAGGKWVIPGLVCGHHHLYSALACGMPFLPEAPTSFTDMLAKVWWRLDKALDEESVELSGLVGAVQALRAGVTTVVDHHASPNFIMGSLETLDTALETAGLRRILCYEVTDRGGPEKALAGLRAHEALLGEEGDEKRAVMIGAHANFTLSDQTLERCGALAREAGVGLHIHVAEAVDDEQTVGEPLIARMDRLGALLPGSLLAHCVHLSDGELAQLEDADVWVAHQPRSNMNNAVGHARLNRFPRRTLLGTDGIGADMFSELQAGYFRGQEAGVNWFPDRWRETLTTNAHFAGSALGVPLGRILPGAAGDLAILDPIPGPPLTADNLSGALIFRMTAAAVRHVVCDGAWVLRDREPTGLDSGTLDKRAQRVAREVWGRMA
jgi:putative selenium metabolism protein SsnA